MVRLRFSIELNYQIATAGCGFIFNVRAAQTRRQSLVQENLELSQPVLSHRYTDPVTHNRYLRIEAIADEHGPLVLPKQVGQALSTNGQDQAAAG